MWRIIFAAIQPSGASISGAATTRARRPGQAAGRASGHRQRAAREQIFEHPRTDYTRALMAAAFDLEATESGAVST